MLLLQIHVFSYHSIRNHMCSCSLTVWVCVRHIYYLATTYILYMSIIFMFSVRCVMHSHAVMYAYTWWKNIDISIHNYNYSNRTFSSNKYDTHVYCC